MKINNNAGGIASKLNEVNSKATQNTKDARVEIGSNKSKAPNSAEVATSADLSISSRAKQRAEELTKIKDIAMNTPDVDEAKVAKFRELIDSGQYKVDAEKVADRLVDDHAVDAILGGQN